MLGEKNVGLKRRFTMKANSVRTLFMAALGLLAAATLAHPAAAQGVTACKGSFRLPKETRWEGRIFPEGDYTFSLESAAMPALIELRGPNVAQILISPSQARQHDSGQSFLAIEWRHGAGYVRELYLAPIGVHFFYLVPKIPKEELLARNTPSIERVLISQTAN
jgi:hypothetical protein